MKDNQKNLVLKVTGAIQIINTENKSIYQKMSSTATRKSYGTRPFRGLGSTRKHSKKMRQKTKTKMENLQVHKKHQIIKSIK